MLALALTPVYANEPVQTAEKSRDAQEAAFQHAQAILDSESASVDALERVRAQLVQFRDAASVIVDRGSVDARAVQAQIDSLGPPPGDNETEPEDIASRRLELVGALAKANEPVRAAGESLERATLLIRETDTMIRSQVTRELNRAGIEIPFPQRDLHLRDIDRLVSAIEGRAAVPEPIAAL
jgi:small-conductance mechanosensitive channel